MKASSFISQIRPGYFRLNVHAKPGAKVSSLASSPLVTDAALEVRVGAPPVEGKANVELVDFMQLLIEQKLNEFRISRCQNVLQPAVRTESRTCKGREVKANTTENKHGKKKNTTIALKQCTDYPEKVRVSLVGGATARYKILEVSFPGTEDEFISVLQSVGAP